MTAIPPIALGLGLATPIPLLAGAIIAAGWLFSRRGLVPDWWLRLRVSLTAAVVSCLAVGALA